MRGTRRHSLGRKMVGGGKSQEGGRGNGEGEKKSTKIPYGLKTIEDAISAP